MKKRILVTPVLACLLIGGLPSQAAALDGSGSVDVVDSGVTAPVDPENPGNQVDPGEVRATTGPLRIDYISALNFGSNPISLKDRSYESFAQLFLDDTSARGYYIQVSDRRENSSGWTLQLKQENQFHSSIIQDLDQQELTGAILSFDNSWANSVNPDNLPTVSRDIIAIKQLNAAYTVATATADQGNGTWTIAFGASEENQSNQKSTLKPMTDKEGNPVVNPDYNKPGVRNSAISLSIPGETTIYPVEYTTTLTWILEASPTG